MYSVDHCRNGLTILNFGELASPPYPSGGGSGGGGSGSAGSGTTGSAGGGSDTESDQGSSVGASVKSTLNKLRLDSSPRKVPSILELQLI